MKKNKEEQKFEEHPASFLITPLIVILFFAFSFMMSSLKKSCDYYKEEGPTIQKIEAIGNKRGEMPAVEMIEIRGSKVKMRIPKR